MGRSPGPRRTPSSGHRRAGQGAVAQRAPRARAPAPHGTALGPDLSEVDTPFSGESPLTENKGLTRLFSREPTVCFHRCSVRPMQAVPSFSIFIPADAAAPHKGDCLRFSPGPRVKPARPGTHRKGRLQRGVNQPHPAMHFKAAQKVGRRRSLGVRPSRRPCCEGLFFRTGDSHVMRRCRIRGDGKSKSRGQPSVCFHRCSERTMQAVPRFFDFRESQPIPSAGIGGSPPLRVGELVGSRDQLEVELTRQVGLPVARPTGVPGDAQEQDRNHGGHGPCGHAAALRKRHL